MAKQKVEHVRTEVREQRDKWDLIKDCIAGARDVKKAGEKYLPRPDPADKSKENRARYDAYKSRAVFYNVTARTLNGLVGQVFHREPTKNLPTDLEIIDADADGSGVPLNQQSQRALHKVLAFGRSGLWVDYPAVEGPTTREDIRTGRIRPTIILVDPWDIINWRTVTVGAQVLYSLIVLKEQRVLEDDGFEQKTEDQYRVLKLDPETMEYTVDLWYANGTGGGLDKQETFVPRDATGKPLKRIPFTFLGATNNDAAIDDPPIYDLAELNIAHYRNSADYEESCYIIGQPTLWASGLDKSWVDDVLEGEIKLGSRNGLPLPKNASTGILQAQPNTMVKEAMDQKEDQMVALGAKLVDPQRTQRTATEAKQDEASEASILTNAAQNVTAGYQEVLGWASQFIGSGNQDFEFELNTDLDATELGPNERDRLVKEWQAGAISFEELRFNLKRAGIAYQEDEKVKQEAEESLTTPVPERPESGSPVEE